MPFELPDPTAPNGASGIKVGHCLPLARLVYPRAEKKTSPQVEVRHPISPYTGTITAKRIRLLGFAVATPILAVDVLAIVHFADLDSPHPLARFVTVSGKSMLPAFLPGQQLLFVRRPGEVGDVVSADVGEDEAVVKRVVKIQNNEVWITGDKRAVTASYVLPADKIVAALAMPTGLRFTPPKETEPQSMADAAGRYSTAEEISQPVTHLR